jgi:hypothetical protein
VKRALAICLVLLVGFSSACSKKQEVVVQTANGKGLTAADIDRDPLALLPSGAVAIAVVDAQKTFASPFGQKLLAIARGRLPLPASAGFDPGRDLKLVAAGVYSMSGVDVAAVATGNFDPDAIAKAASGTGPTPLGLPVLTTHYAGRTMYTVASIGFVVLTTHTALFGDQTGMRRALDRIQEGRVQRDLPAWLVPLVKNQKAPLVAGFDLKSQSLSDAVRKQLPFLQGLETARVLGNFQPPGLNFAGTFSYDTADDAQKGATNLAALRDTLKSYAPILALLGISQPVQKLEARAEDKDTQVVVGLDGGDVNKLLDKLSSLLGVPIGPKVVPATTSAPVSN